MTFDPRTFVSSVVTDTCAVWNVLSSTKLYRTAFKAKATFRITRMVLFECTLKPRKFKTEEQAELLRRFEEVRKDGKFEVHECELEDLLSVSRVAPIGLGSGELSCIASCFKTRELGFMTDERQARVFAEDKLALKVETTPRLYGWLHYHRLLLDGDHQDIVDEHKRFERRPLTPFFETAYHSALEYRLMERQGLPSKTP